MEGGEGGREGEGGGGMLPAGVAAGVGTASDPSVTAGAVSAGGSAPRGSNRSGTGISSSTMLSIGSVVF